MPDKRALPSLSRWGPYSTPTSTHFTVEGAAMLAVTLQEPEALLGTVTDVVPEPITVAALSVK